MVLQQNPEEILVLQFFWNDFLTEPGFPPNMQGSTWISKF